MKNVIAVIGAGGKTTAMEALARKGATGSVLVTTTTHIYPMTPPMCRACLTDPTPEGLSEALRTPGILCAGSTAKEGKLGILPEPVLKQGLAAADLVIYEGDGAHRMPLKLHRPGEPVLLTETTHCLVVAGLSALGQPVEKAVHRYQRNPLWKGSPHQLVGPEDIIHCVLETVNASGFPQQRIRLLLNQTDVLPYPNGAKEIQERLQAWGLQVRVGSLQKNPEILEDWGLVSF